MNIGWDPLLCISDQLLCDGITHCPKNSLYSDEDEKLCKNHKDKWQKFATNIIKHFEPPDILNIKWMHDKAIQSLNETELNQLRNEYEQFINFSEYKSLYYFFFLRSSFTVICWSYIKK